MSAGRILVVDDEPEIRRLVQEILQDEHYAVTTAADAAGARTAYKQQPPDLVLLDIWMPDTDGISLLKEWREAEGYHAPVIMISGHGNVETAVEAIRLGAQDFIEKPLSTGKLLVTIERVLEAERLRRENARLRQRVEPAAVLVGKSQAMQAWRTQLERVAAHETWALITGEPGSGKAVAARYLHAHSPRAAGPLVEVSLAAVPAQNVAAQLFGSEAGGQVVVGSLERASGGTLLLDEIGDLDRAAQSRLLGALTERRFLRVGGTQPTEVDVRVVAASSRDLGAAVAAGAFREDLYYRLNVVPLRVPPLREHRDDVPELVNFYLDWFVEHERLPYRRFTIGALNLLRNYAWPGNIRELKNLVQRLLILHRTGDIDVAEVEQALGAQRPVGEDVGEAAFQMPLREARDRFERAYLEYHLKRTGGNVSEVATYAQMERTHLYRKLKGLGIDPRTGKDD
jgi:DNA-binding NtrC family response regulator